MKKLFFFLLLTALALPVTAQRLAKNQLPPKEKLEKMLDLRPQQKKAFAALREEVNFRLNELKEQGKLTADSPGLAELRRYELTAIDAILDEKQRVKLAEYRNPKVKPSVRQSGGQ